MLKFYRHQNLIQRGVTNLVFQQKQRKKWRKILNVLHTFDSYCYEMIVLSFNRLRKTPRPKISPLVSTTYDDIFITNKIFEANKLRMANNLNDAKYINAIK